MIDVKRRSFSLWFIVFAGIAAIAGGCGATGDDSSIDSADGLVSSEAVESADSDEGSDGSDQTDAEDSDGASDVAEEAEPTPVDSEEAVAAYVDFLRLRDDAYMNPDGDISSLQAVAGDGVIDEVRGFWARNEAFLSADVGILARSSSSNIVDTEEAGQTVKILDCVEMRHENQDDLGSPVRFLEHEATMVAGESGWVVESIAVVRSGDVADSEWFGCVPDYHAERVTATIAHLGDGNYEWRSDRDSVVPDGLFAAFNDRLQADAEAAVAQQNEENGGRFLSSVEERRVKVAGSDVGTGGWNFLVELCTHYPDGEIWTDVASGAEVESSPPDFSRRVGYRVLSVEQADGSWVDEIVDLTPVESPSPCWTEE